MPAEATTTKSLFISVITPGGLGSEDKEAVQQNKDCRLRVIIMQVEWNQDMLQSVAGYGIDIEFNMLTAGCLQNPKYVTSLKNVCDWLMPTEKEEREKI